MVKPSVGRIVHYSLGPGADPRAAVITQCMNPKTEMPDEMTVGLAILSPTGMNFQPEVPYSQDTNKQYTWSWPPAAKPEVSKLVGV